MYVRAEVLGHAGGDGLYAALTARVSTHPREATVSRHAGHVDDRPWQVSGDQFSRHSLTCEERSLCDNIKKRMYTTSHRLQYKLRVTKAQW